MVIASNPAGECGDLEIAGSVSSFDGLMVTHEAGSDMRGSAMRNRCHGELVEPFFQFSADDESGFTLLELLIALTLLAAITGILAGGLHLSVRAWEAGGERLEGRHEAAESMNLIKRQLKGARNVSYIPADGKGSKRIAFIGERESVTFVTSKPRFRSKREAAGLYIQRIENIPEKGGLIFMEAEFDPSRDMADYDWTEMRMGDKWVDSFRFEYLVKNSIKTDDGKPETAFEWLESVNSSGDTGKAIDDKFPAAVRFRLTAAGEPDNFVWPATTAPIYTDAEIDFNAK